MNKIGCFMFNGLNKTLNIGVNDVSLQLYLRTQNAL